MPYPRREPIHLPQAGPLRSDRCPECGYLLTGMPEQGLCPECGFPYDPSLIVLWGWARGVRATGANTRFGLWRWLRSYLLPVVLVALIGGGLFWETWPLLLLGLAAAVALSVDRRRRLLQSEHPPVQVRLFPRGFGQRNGVGPVELQPWKATDRLYINCRKGGWYRIRSYPWYFYALAIDAIDFQFQSDAQTVRRIQECVQEWRSAHSRMQSILQRCKQGEISREQADQEQRAVVEDLQRRGLWPPEAAE